MLEIKNVTKIFNPDIIEDKRVALDSLSLTIEEGEFVTVIGSNGSGKSTLLNIINGKHLPDVGKVILDGEDITNLKQHQKAKYIGTVFQDPHQGTASQMSVLENLEIAKRRGKRKTLRWGFSAQNREDFIIQLSKLDLGLENRLTQRIGTLSGGQRQAITLIMATLNNPKLLLLDEHTAALDPNTATKVLEITNDIIKAEKLTTIMVTHNMRDAINYGDRLIMLDQGKIIFDCKGEEKKNLTIPILLQKFSSKSVINDELILS
ncbi:MAG TPA: ATP-binding cassette domain-containing protein [Bacilli bacterium]|nr:ATP-binding cassette domain-containing protein [Bacilli bacterium]HOH59115.1 ATP-binding cassette domain-containing protein [Bacilli bacterium]HPA98757.1 ATP-binding cassette domain-containing protein [Bacilli bacterium]HQB79960.1 ATP-binding cassette domain-containing protein [Bacilli bacterium]HQO93963.1 ATP-binding cassette domain-containing protein [Bacilli bacterium]